jgi:formylglycine-generating enzyme required for sulfatase activity
MAESPSSEYDLAPAPGEEKPRPGGPGVPITDDDDEPIVPAAGSRPVGGPPKPLPRIHKSAPLTVGEAEAPASSPDDPDRPRPSKKERQSARERERARAKAGVGDDDLDAKKPMEATPEFDTVETRQRVRLILGLVAAGAVGLAIFMVFRAIVGAGSSADEEAVYEIIDPSFGGGPAIASKPPGPAPAPGVAPPGVNRDATAPALAPTAPTSPSTVPPSPYNPVVATAPGAAAPISEGADQPGVVLSRGPLPRGFQAHPQARIDALGWPDRIVCERDGSEMVLVPAGVYLLGRPDGSLAEAPPVRVEIPAFYLDRTEITVDQYNRYRAELARQNQTLYPDSKDLAEAAPTGSHPVVLVNWMEASQYAAWAGKTLPTEAQWEAAARGRDGLLRPWGASTPAWASTRLPRQIHPVGSFEEDRSPFDLLDLASNAWEWTADWYDSRYHELLTRQLVANPAGPSSSKTTPPQRTIKGSSRSLETSYREGMRPDARLPYLGFRCCLPISGPPRLIDASAPSAAPGRPSSPPPSSSSPGGVVPF